MRFYVGVTDTDWFTYLEALKPDEVNFWQPGGNTSFKVLQPGQPFLFKLHSPHNYIVGGGWFLSHSFLPVSLAWEAFGDKNGVPSFDVLSTKIAAYRRGAGGPDPTIGCIILSKPFFLDRSRWIPVPKDWSPNIVQGKGFSTNDPNGESLWQQVTAQLMHPEIAVESTSDIELDYDQQYGAEYLTRARLGQGAFRVLVTDAYGRRCAVTGERTLPVLEAAHIKPFAQSGPHMLTNGLLLRSDLHKLFDLGYMTVDPELRVEISKRIREEFENGRDYYALHGKELASTPTQQTLRPAKQFLEWHNENVYKG